MTLHPQRIQRKRTKGWRMPQGAVYVGRPTIWGNPFRIGDGVTEWPYREFASMVDDTQTAVYLFELMATASAGYTALVRGGLAGKDPVCWCPLGEPCHADVLLEIANGGAA